MNFVRTVFAGTAVLTVCAGLSALGTGLAYVKRLEPTLPGNDAIVHWQPKQGTTILAEDGTVLGVHASQFRKFVPLDEMPKLLVDAFVSAEDGQYWRHRGVNPVAIARAVISNVRHPNGRKEGGSTITQQVVKNLLLSPERKIDRKIKEALLALRADREIGKRRIIEIYLNEIYLGDNSYGVAAAAMDYFGKDLRDLTVSEMAVLAALPQAPGAVNPVKNLRRTVERRNYVLGRMLAEGYIAKTVHDAAMAEPVIVTRKSAAASEPEFAFRSPEEAVRRSLVSELGADKVYRDGGDTRTTIDPTLQRAVHRELRAGLVREDRRGGWRGPLARRIAFPVDWNDPDLAPPPGAEDWKVGVVADAGRDAEIETKDGIVTVPGDALAWAGRGRKAANLLARGDAVLVGDLGSGPEIVSVPAVQGAVVVLDPETGGIRALDGGFSAEESEFNRATQAKRQTGSVFKAFVYLSALEMGYDAMSPILDVPIALDQGPGLGDWRPTSHDGGLGLITLRRSLELSRNESTVRLLYDIGTDTVAATAAKAGFKVPPTLSYSMALGTAETTPLNVAEAYATLANGGHHVTPTFFAKTVAEAEGPAVFDPVPVAQLSSILEGVTYAGTAKGAFEGFDKPISAKTGTTDKSKDAWFAAYGPKFVIVVWVGNDNSAPLAKGAAGGTTAGSIARGVLDSAAGEFDFAPFTLPDGAETVIVDRETGMPDDNGDVVEIVRGKETGDGKR
jgi:penicillin-binding protein 1A